MLKSFNWGPVAALLFCVAFWATAYHLFWSAS